jgi:hypothetical protein
MLRQAVSTGQYLDYVCVHVIFKRVGRPTLNFGSLLLFASDNLRIFDSQNQPVSYCFF